LLASLLGWPHLVGSLVIVVILADTITPRIQGPLSDLAWRLHVGGYVLYHGLGLKVVGHDTLVGRRLLGLIHLAVGVLAHKSHLAATLLFYLFNVVVRQGLGLSMVTPEDFTVALGKPNDFSRRLLFAFHRFSVVLGARPVSGLLSLLFLARGGLFAALFPEVVDGSPDVGLLAAGFLHWSFNNHLFLWAVVVNSYVYLFLRHLSYHVHLVPCKLLILAIRLSQVGGGVVLPVAVGVVDLLLLLPRHRDVDVLPLSVGRDPLPGKIVGLPSNIGLKHVRMNSLHKLVSQQLIILLLLQLLVGARNLAARLDFGVAFAGSSHRQSLLKSIVSGLLIQSHLGVSVLSVYFGRVSLCAHEHVVNSLLSLVNTGVLRLQLQDTTLTLERLLLHYHPFGHHGNRLLYPMTSLVVLRVHRCFNDLLGRVFIFN